MNTSGRQQSNPRVVLRKGLPCQFLGAPFSPVLSQEPVWEQLFYLELPLLPSCKYLPQVHRDLAAGT